MFILMSYSFIFIVLLGFCSGCRLVVGGFSLGTYGSKKKKKKKKDLTLMSSLIVFSPFFSFWSGSDCMKEIPACMP